jgi:hypothetical protein
MKRVGNIQGNDNQKRDKSNDENTSSAIEGDEEYGKEYDSSDEELVVLVMIKRQDNYKEPCLC